MRNVLLLGATGLVGRELLRILLDDASIAQVRVLARRASGMKHAKLDERVIELDAMTVAHFAGIDQIFCALGTTMRVAGSEEAFRHVDHDLPILAAQRGREAGAHHYLLVTALGAKRDSRIFYNRVKGDVEADLIALGYPSITIARPSFLVGEREDSRLGERIAARLAWLMPRRIRPIAAHDVALALADAARADAPGVRVVESREMQRG